MLSSTDLFFQLKNNVFNKQLGDGNNYRKTIGDTIIDYIQNNAIVKGIYTGATPPPIPVPVTLPGTGKIKITSFDLPLGTEAGMNVWWTSWCISLLQPSIEIILDTPLVGTGTIILTPILIPPVSRVEIIDTIWQPICDSIIQTIKTGIIPPITTACVSPISSGTFNFTEVS